MSTTEQNQSQNGTAGAAPAHEKKSAENTSVTEWHTFPIRELVAKTFDDGSRIHNVEATAQVFDAFADSIDEWLENYRAGKRLSRVVAIAIAKLKLCVTDLEGKPIWAIKNKTAWKILYSDRIKPFYASLGMTDDEVKALEASTKQYNADRGVLVAVIADYCIRNTNNLKDEKWILDPKSGEEFTVREAVDVMLGDDQSAASKFEGKKLPPLLQKAITEQYNRTKYPPKHKKAGQRAQGFEKIPTYFGPEKNPKPAGGGGGGGGGGYNAIDTAKGYSDSLRELALSGGISTHAYVAFLREQMSTLNTILLKAAAPKGGQVPGIVDMLDDMAKESKLLADWRRPNSDRKPEKDAVAKAAVEIPAK